MVEVDIKSYAVSTHGTIIAKWWVFDLPFTEIHKFFIATTLYQFLNANQSNRLFFPSFYLKLNTCLLAMNRYLSLPWQFLLRFWFLLSAEHRWLRCFLFFYWIHQLLCFRLFLPRLPKRILLWPPLHIEVKKREIMLREFCPRGWRGHDPNNFLTRYFLFLFLFFAIVSIFFPHPQLLLSVFLLLKFS